MYFDTTIVGLDVHTKRISVAVIAEGSSNVTNQWEIDNTQQSVKRLVKRLQKLSGDRLRLVYEAGPCGNAFYRQAKVLGQDCRIIAPSLIPQRSGDRVKTDRRDARKLATLYRAGLLTEVSPPTPDEESVRDLLRARESAKQALMAARHRVSKMLLRWGYQFTQTKNWTRAHKAWLKRIRFDHHWAQVTFEHYLLAMEQIEEQLSRMEDHVKEVAQGEAYAQRVGWLSCLRGVSTVTAMTILAELHGFERFQSARELMAYLGLTPSEHSSGGRTRKGSITKAGNSHVRKMLMQAAWNYHHRPSVSALMRKQREGQPAAVLAIADRAQLRLYGRYHRLTKQNGKHHNVAVTAVARELVGFIWAVLNHHRGLS